MTFSEYIIQKKSKNFYWYSLIDISNNNSTLEEWFGNMYLEYKNLQNKNLKNEI